MQKTKRWPQLSTEHQNRDIIEIIQYIEQTDNISKLRRKIKKTAELEFDLEELL